MQTLHIKYVWRFSSKSMKNMFKDSIPKVSEAIATEAICQRASSSVSNVQQSLIFLLPLPTQRSSIILAVPISMADLQHILKAESSFSANILFFLSNISSSLCVSIRLLFSITCFGSSLALDSFNGWIYFPLLSCKGRHRE